jgi:hypothetical protein
MISAADIALIVKSNDPGERPHLREGARLMLTVPELHRSTVGLASNRLVNTSPGWRHSDALRHTVREYHERPAAFWAGRAADAEFDRRERAARGY